MSLVSDMRKEAQKSGANKGKLLYFSAGKKIRIRFLSDMEDGLVVVKHDDYDNGVNTICYETFDEECPHCDVEGMRTRNQYAWSVWDYEAKEVKILFMANNNCTAIPHLLNFYESYGHTITDRDYVLTKNGQGTQSSYSVVPMDVNKFRNEKAKPFSNSKLLQILKKAFVDETEFESSTGSKGKKRKVKKSDSLTSESVYDGMTARELYDECLQRFDAEDVPKRKPEQFYIDMLEEDDLENANAKDGDDWDEEGDEVDYSEMSAQDLFKLCNERGIEALKRKPEKYYIRLLEENDKQVDDWDDESEDENEEW